MRIAIVNAYGHLIGGADYHCLTLGRALEDNGHDVEYLTTASQLNSVRRGRFVPLTVSHETRDSLSTRKRVAAAWNALWNADAASAMRRLITEYRPDIIHAHKLYNQLSAAPVVVAAQAHIPIVQTLHDYEFISANPYDHRARRIDRDEDTISYRTLNTLAFAARRRLHTPRVGAWISVSQFVAELHAAHGIPSIVLPNFVARTEFTPISKFNQRSGAVFVGTLSEQKGIHDVITLAKAQPELSITVAGRGRLTGNVERAAAVLSNLNFVGFVDGERVTELLRSAKIALMPSHYQDPGPIAALEAMAVGTPVVAYRSGGLAEYIDGSGAGVVVEPNAAEIMQAALELLESRQRWEACSTAGPEAVRSRHNLDDYVAQLEEIYRDLDASRTY
jgi:glycosyltransferase involved in cell wall biosynthesis